MHDSSPALASGGAREVVLRVGYRDDVSAPADYLTDLDRAGFFLRTTRPLQIGERIPLTLSFPGLLAPLDVGTRVVELSAPDQRSPDAPHGARVEFVFEDRAHAQAIAALIARFESATTTPLAPFRVLLVEDNNFAHKLFRHAVRRFHYEWSDGGALEIIGVGDGLEALAVLEEATIDLAIVDFFLPAMGGAELIRRMRRDPRWARTPILVISVGGDGVRQEAIDAGADLYLDKPVLLKQLLTTLHLLIGAPQAAAGVTP
jgi:CheY-like chemotaxis protein